MVTVGGVASASTVSVAVPVLPAASRAVTVSTLVPGWRVIPLADQVVVPVAVPLPPRSFAQVTRVTPMLSVVVPPRLSGLAPVVCVPDDVGEVIVTVGWLASAR